MNEEVPEQPGRSWRRFLPHKKSAWLLIFLCLLVTTPFWLLLYLFADAESQINRHLHSQTWSLPSTIYADSPVLFEEMPVRPRSLVNYFQRLNYHRQESGRNV